METTALYIGYAILAILGLALTALALFTVYLTAIGIYRIVTTKQTIRFMQRAEAKATNEGAKAAYDYLIKHGCSQSDTLEDVARLIDKHSKRHNL